MDPMKLTAIAAIALIAALASAAAATTQSTHSKKHHVARNAAEGHVACTKLGCFATPANCQPQTQFDWWGNPTGYDQIVCGRR
jgi:hypothetical protein